jgi:aminopeptidase N
MADRRYKYRREDFVELPVALNHLTIYLNFLEDRVEATNSLDMTSKVVLEKLALDAKNLDILNVEWCSGPSGEATRLAYEYNQKRDKLLIDLPKRVEAGERFVVRISTHCFPNDHIFEGIYKDATPPGAPQQYMSQCQQWGFQRIMPILDDCRAKCTMTTTIEADAAYTHLISNGNISKLTNPEGKPVLKPGDPNRQVITYENPIPMAPYLFLVCAGTWDDLVDSVTYDSGRTVRLEYLVPPGSTDGALIPMEILKKSIIWVGRTQGYEYTGDTYRTICMNKSNFGGMENVGNTTIVTDAALINEHTLDTSLLYAHAVIVHEFEHNQCGSETTMETPFDVWLNEAYTVDVERQFMSDLFDPAFIRLHQVETIRNPLLGPLAIEDGGHVGRIVREGFNDPDELIDGVTYVKAAEVIRMLRLILGDENFRKGKSLYFSRFRHANANTDQFFACFEESSGLSLDQFKSQWLYTIGYPMVTARTIYDATSGQYRILFRQQLKAGLKPFHIPIALALVDGQGGDIAGTQQVFQLRETEGELVYANLKESPAFASMNRDYSFYGTFEHENADTESLILQIRFDPNPYNRVDGVRKLTDRQRIKLLMNPEAEIDPIWLELYGEILSDESLPASLKAYFLRIEEQPMDRRYSTWYPELVRAREKLMLSVNRAYRERLESLLQLLVASDSKHSINEAIQERMLKQVLLDLIAIDDTPASHQLVLKHFQTSDNATDRVAALMALNRSSAPERLDVLEQVYIAWHKHLSGYANYLRIVASGACSDVFDMIEKERRRSSFDVTQPTWCRALFLPMAVNNKMVWTDQGINWVTDTVINLAPINATTTSRLLNTFQHVKVLKPELQRKVKKALDRIVKEVTEEISPTIHGQAMAYVEGLQ